MTSDVESVTNKDSVAERQVILGIGDDVLTVIGGERGEKRKEQGEDGESGGHEFIPSYFVGRINLHQEVELCSTGQTGRSVPRWLVEASWFCSIMDRDFRGRTVVVAGHESVSGKYVV